ncbi:MAG: hypothetical protein Q9223_005199 [Gallowayella weberi]
MAGWPGGLLSTIAESLWFIVHLELNVELLLPAGTKPGQPELTLDSVREIWNFLWADIMRVRKERNHMISRPRLQTLTIRSCNASKDPVDFEARLSERDDLAIKGHAEVVCLQLEGLEEKYGNGPLENELMEIFRSYSISRVEKGRITQEPSGWDIPAYIQARPLKTTLSTMADW